jgi:hypothetical protein
MPTPVRVVDGEATLLHGHTYAATVSLSGVEPFASNEHIADMLAKMGFSNVAVTGGWSTRQAKGTWNGGTLTGPVDPHLSTVVDLS